MKNSLVIWLLIIGVNTTQAQKPMFANCNYVNQEANEFVAFVQKASKAIANNQTNDTLIPTVKAKMKIVESRLSAAESRHYDYSTEPDFINYSLTRCYTAYFAFLLRIKEEKLIDEIAVKNDAYFTKIYRPSDIDCEVMDNVKKNVTRSGIDDDNNPYSYTEEAYMPTVVGRLKVSKKEVLQNKAGLFSSVILAESKLKNYAMVEKYFEAAYQANVWVNTDGILPVSSSKYALHNYNEQATVIDSTTLHAAISNSLATVLWANTQNKIAPTASDTFYHKRAVEILLKVAKTKLDATKISREDLYKLMANVVSEKLISKEDKIEALKLNFEFYTVYQPQGEYNPLQCYFLYDIFYYIPDYLKDIWASNDKILIESFVRCVNKNKFQFLDNNKQLLYGVYLYCRDNGYKSIGKEIYNSTLGKYAKEQYPK